MLGSIFSLSLFTMVLAANSGQLNPQNEGFTAEFYEYRWASYVGWEEGFFLDGYKTELVTTVTGVHDVNFLSLPEMPFGLQSIYDTDVDQSFTLRLSGFYKSTVDDTLTFDIRTYNGLYMSFGPGKRLHSCHADDDSSQQKEQILGLRKDAGTTWDKEEVTGRFSVDVKAGMYYPISIVAFNVGGIAALSLRVTDAAGNTRKSFGSDVFQVAPKCSITTTSMWDNTFVSTKTQIGSSTDIVIVNLPKTTITTTTTWYKAYMDTSTIRGASTNTVMVRLPIPTRTATQYWTGRSKTTMTSTGTPGGHHLVVVKLPHLMTTTTRTWTGSGTKTSTQTGKETDTVIIELPIPTSTTTQYWTGKSKTTMTSTGTPGGHHLVVVQLPHSMTTTTRTWTGSGTKTSTQTGKETDTVIIELPIPTSTTTQYWTGKSKTTMTSTGTPGGHHLVVVQLPHSMTTTTRTWTGSGTKTSTQTGKETDTVIIELPIPTSTTTQYWTEKTKTTMTSTGTPGGHHLVVVQLPLSMTTTTRTWTGSGTKTSTQTGKETDTVIIELPIPTSTTTQYWTGKSKTIMTSTGTPGGHHLVVVQLPHSTTATTRTRREAGPTTSTKADEAINTVIDDKPALLDNVIRKEFGLLSSSDVESEASTDTSLDFKFTDPPERLDTTTSVDLMSKPHETEAPMLLSESLPMIISQDEASDADEIDFANEHGSSLTNLTKLATKLGEGKTGAFASSPKQVQAEENVIQSKGSSLGELQIIDLPSQTATFSAIPETETTSHVPKPPSILDISSTVLIDLIQLSSETLETTDFLSLATAPFAEPTSSLVDSDKAASQVEDEAASSIQLTHASVSSDDVMSEIGSVSSFDRFDEVLPSTATHSQETTKTSALKETSIDAISAEEMHSIETHLIATISSIESPSIETSLDQISLLETPSIETPSIETPSIETPSIETSSIETSSIEISIETSSIETSSIETSSIETSSIETSSIETSSIGNNLSLECKTVECSFFKPTLSEAFSLETSSVEMVETHSTETSQGEIFMGETISVETFLPETSFAEASFAEASLPEFSLVGEVSSEAFVHATLSLEVVQPESLPMRTSSPAASPSRFSTAEASIHEFALEETLFPGSSSDSLADEFPSESTQTRAVQAAAQNGDTTEPHSTENIVIPEVFETRITFETDIEDSTTPQIAKPFSDFVTRKTAESPQTIEAEPPAITPSLITSRVSHIPENTNDRPEALGPSEVQFEGPHEIQFLGDSVWRAPSLFYLTLAGLFIALVG